MSSAVNHKRRSHRSERGKAGVYRTSTRRAIYRSYREQRNRGILSRLSGIFRRNAFLQRLAAVRKKKEDETE